MGLYCTFFFKVLLSWSRFMGTKINYSLVLWIVCLGSSSWWVFAFFFFPHLGAPYIHLLGTKDVLFFKRLLNA